MQAIRKTVIVEMIDDNNTTESGLIIKSQQRDYPPATVVSVGPQVDCGVKIGDRVYVDWGRVGKFEHASRTYYVTDQTNLLGVFTE